MSGRVNAARPVLTGNRSTFRCRWWGREGVPPWGSGQAGVTFGGSLGARELRSSGCGLALCLGCMAGRREPLQVVEAVVHRVSDVVALSAPAITAGLVLIGLTPASRAVLDLLTALGPVGRQCVAAP